MKFVVPKKVIEDITNDWLTSDRVEPKLDVGKIPDCLAKIKAVYDSNLDRCGDIPYFWNSELDYTKHEITRDLETSVLSWQLAKHGATKRMMQKFWKRVKRRMTKDSIIHWFEYDKHVLRIREVCTLLNKPLTIKSANRIKFLMSLIEVRFRRWKVAEGEETHEADGKKAFLDRVPIEPIKDFTWYFDRKSHVLTRYRYGVFKTGVEYYLNDFYNSKP